MNAVATHIEYCGMRFPRDPADIARDQWIAERTPVVLDALETQDKALADAFSDVFWERHPAALDAYRANDAEAFLRIVRGLVRAELANDADCAIENEAYKRFPERVFPDIAPPKVNNDEQEKQA